MTRQEPFWISNGTPHALQVAWPGMSDRARFFLPVGSAIEVPPGVNHVWVFDPVEPSTDENP